MKLLRQHQGYLKLILSNTMRVVWFALLSCYGFIAMAQDPPQFGEPFDGVPDPRDVNMYQVNIRAFSGNGDLNGVTARLDNIADVGTNVIYLMPVFPVGEDARSIVASSASPYSIKDFTAVGSEYGSLADLRRLVEGAHQRGMAVILDFVVNQTSWDHPWITEHPDWYVRENGEIQQLREFSDVAALDFSNQEMRDAVIEDIRYWVFAANVDGFRMDFANNPPLDFWTQANSSLRDITSHDLLLFAEGDRLANFNVDFDINFGDKWYYDAIRPIAQGSSVSQIQNTNNIEYTNANEIQQVARYTGNHDTNGNGTSIEVFGSIEGVLANFVVSAYMKGIPFLYGGQEVAFPTRIPFPWDAVDVNWNANANITAEFKKILDFRTQSTAIRRGNLANFSNNNICAFTKTAGEEEVLVLTNLRSGGSEISLPLNITGASWSDAYTGEQVNFNNAVSLSGFEYRVYTKSTGGTGNFRPTADAGEDRSLTGGSTSVNLDGSGTDADDDALIYTWRQISGPAATIVNSNNANTSVSGLSNASQYEFELTVSDGTLEATDTVEISVGQVTVDQSPFGGSSRAIPGLIEIEDYDNGGQGVSYADSDTSNNGGAFRRDQGVDLENCTEGGFNLGWTTSGEYTEYTVTVAASGSYIAELRIAADIGGSASLLFDGQDKTGSIAIPNTNGWQNWQTVKSSSFSLNAGTQVLRFAVNQGGFNVNNIRILANEGDTNNNNAIVQIKNRFLADSYLYDNGDQTSYGNVTDDRAQWEQIVSNGFTLFKNVATGDYLNIENEKNYVESNTAEPGFWSAQWSLESFDGFIRLRNRWRNDRYINNEQQNGNVQATGGLFNGSYSSHFTLIPVNTAGSLAISVPDDTEFNRIRVYPVPATTTLNLALPQTSTPTLVQLTDLSGNSVLQTTLENGGVQSLDIQRLNKGVYILTIDNGNTKTVRTVLKQ